jgi:hypothetical protein
LDHSLNISLRLRHQGGNQGLILPQTASFYDGKGTNT